ncbi:hypothetical protein GQ44DRAFT_282556 [Phaeosphaeriaceae sp. PMI808]|nr:hypothetical protein GQ44DRAFT_282556 [Phaeosphaeriaceae sp. PMI808]
MPSRPLDSGWNFSPVFDLIDSDTHNTGSPALRPAARSIVALSSGDVGLGDFWKLYESLGIPNVQAVPPLESLDESELSNSDDPLLPSPLLDATPATSHDVGNDDLAQPNNSNPPGLSKKQRQKARKRAEKALLEQTIKSKGSISEEEKSIKSHENESFSNETNIAVKSPNKPQSNVGLKLCPANPTPNTAQVPKTPITVTPPALNNRPLSSFMPATPQPRIQPAPPQDLLAPQYPPQLQPSQIIVSVGSGLVPRNVRPVTLPRHSYPTILQPQPPTTPTHVPSPSRYSTPLNRPTITIRSQVDRHFNLFEKLLNRFPDERKWLVAPRQLINETTRAEGVHLFVDASNIMIGFKDMSRMNGIQPYDMSFDSLALLMERRRPVARRELVGSHREANPLPQTTRLVETSKAVGYECSIQEQVYIAREVSQKKKFFNDVSRLGWQKAIQKRSGSGSDSETGAATVTQTPPSRWVEQGVDELLHLKMCQSLLDTDKPSTMVLATGDGAEAEMSDGFLRHVERALNKGWKVELITWRQQTNRGYRRGAFRRKWGEQFTIIELDDFLEDLIETS